MKKQPAPALHLHTEAGTRKHGQRKRKAMKTPQFTTRKVLDGDALYSNPETPIAKGEKKIEVIYDTGAAITQFPAEYQHAWTDLQPCAHTVWTSIQTSREPANWHISCLHHTRPEKGRTSISRGRRNPIISIGYVLIPDTQYLMAGTAPQ